MHAQYKMNGKLTHVGNQLLFMHVFYMYLGVLGEGIKAVLQEPSFQIQSDAAKSCLELAQQLSSWLPQNQDSATTFEKKVVDLFSKCVKQNSRGKKLSGEKCGQLTTLYAFLKNTFLCGKIFLPTAAPQCHLYSASM